MGEAPLLYSGYDVCAVISLLLSSTFIVYQYYFLYYVWYYTGEQFVNLLSHIAEALYKNDAELGGSGKMRKSTQRMNLAVFQRNVEGFLLIGFPLLACLASFVLIFVAIFPPGGESNQAITSDNLRYRGTYIAALVMSCVSLLPFVASLLLTNIFPKFFSNSKAWRAMTGSAVLTNAQSPEMKRLLNMGLRKSDVEDLERRGLVSKERRGGKLRKQNAGRFEGGGDGDKGSDDETASLVDGQ